MVMPSVENKSKGNTFLSPKQAQASTERVDELPDDKKVSSEVPTITQTQLNEALRLALNEPGRKLAEAQKEILKYKADSERLAGELKDNQSDIESLQAKYDEMAKDDPDKIALGKELKAARDERKQLKADKQALEAEKISLEPIRQQKRNDEIFAVAFEYQLPEGDTYDRLYDLCDTFGAKTTEDYRKAADILWKKKAVTPAEPEQKKQPDTPITLVTGKSNGGNAQLSKSDLKNMTTEERRVRSSEIAKLSF